MAVPKFFEFFVPTLKALYHNSPLKSKVLREQVADDMHLTAEDKAELLPSGKQPTYANRILWSIQYLKNAGLIDSISRGEYVITEEGRKVYTKDSDKLDLHYLNRYDSFRKFNGSKSNKEKKSSNIISASISEDVTPFESIAVAYNTIRTELAKSLIQSIMACSPEFFEHLVIDLLLAMGYGYDTNEAGMVVGKTGDGGIDGIINEDKLGFSQVYVQAKRWDLDNTIGSSTVQAFVGALIGKGATKGLFITTSQFSKAAQKYVDDQKAVRIVLIDGEELTRLMIDYGIGVSTQRTFDIKQIDTDYFDD